MDYKSRWHLPPSSQCFDMTWPITYVFYWNLQFLNNVIINKTKVLLPPGIGDRRRFWITCLGPFGLLSLKDILIIWLSSLLIMSVPDDGVVRTRFDTYVFGNLIWKPDAIICVFNFSSCILIRTKRLKVEILKGKSPKSEKVKNRKTENKMSGMSKLFTCKREWSTWKIKNFNSRFRANISLFRATISI